MRWCQLQRGLDREDCCDCGATRRMTSTSTAATRNLELSGPGQPPPTPKRVRSVLSRRSVSGMSLMPPSERVRRYAE